MQSESGLWKDPLHVKMSNSISRKNKGEVIFGGFKTEF
jgi:hypothetical protein